MSWREGFHRAIADYLDRSLPEQRPHREWGKVAEILDVREDIEEGAQYDTGADASQIELTIAWVNTAGERFEITDYISLAEFMRQLN